MRVSVSIISRTMRGTRSARRWTQPVSRTSVCPSIRATDRLPPRISRATDWYGTMLMPRPDATIDLMISTFSVSATTRGLMSARTKNSSMTRRVLEPPSNRMNGCRDERGRRDRPCRSPAGVPQAPRAAVPRESTGTVASAGSSIGSVSKPEVGAARPQLAQQARRAAGDHLDVDVGVVPAELLQQRREDVEAHRHAADEPQRAGQLLLRVEDAFGRVADVGEHPMAQLQQRFAGRRDLDAAAEPDEQRLLEFFFEQQDLTADRRLRDVQPRAGGGERTALGNRAQDFELSQIHRH